MLAYQTDERLKSYLDTNQLYREQLCRAILAIDKRFSEVRPRHPRGGPDGGRDIEALYKDELLTYGAVGFINQANDSKEQKKTIFEKFYSDLESVICIDKKPNVFIFFTNLNLTIGEKDALIEKARQQGITHCEIFDREILRIALDNPDGFSIRFQYLNLPLSEEEQASFFARWGDDIQTVISTGFQRIERALNRLLFLQESNDSINYLTLLFELDKKYSANEIGHFRLFCFMYLKQPKHEIFEIVFGSSDRSERMNGDKSSNFDEQLSGIRYGISEGQWERGFEIDLDLDLDKGEHYKQVGYSSGIGKSEMDHISVTYRKDSFIQISPILSIKDIDRSSFLPIANKSLAEKIKTIHVYANGYKIQEIIKDEFWIDFGKVEPIIPVAFTPQELNDPWVRIRPKDLISSFQISFFEKTPKRISTFD